MKNILILPLIFLTIIIAGTPVLSQSNAITISTEKVVISGKKYYMHTVQSGQTAYSISKAYNILLSELAEENPGVFDGLSVGQHLKIPIIQGRNASADEIKYADKFNYHYIEKGQTLYSVAKYYNTNISTIVKWNPDSENSFNPGKVLRIPKEGEDTEELYSIFFTPESTEIVKTEPTDNSKYLIHTVERGQTLYSISKLYNVKIAEILLINPGLESSLDIGQKIKIPKEENVVITEVREEKPANEIITRDAKSFFEHTVEKGETLYSLSRKYNITKEEIKKYNQGISAAIPIGTVLQIPVFEDAEVVEIQVQEKDTFKIEDKKYYYHKVEKAETLYEISKFYNIKERKIKKANRELKERDIIEGEVIRIPKKYIRDIFTVAQLVKERYAKVTEKKKTNEIVIEDSEEVFPCSTFDYSVESPTYNIALMLPFYLYENDTLVLNDSLRAIERASLQQDVNNDAFDDKDEILIFQKSKVFLEFYEGFLLAVDSVRKTGLSVNINVYDTENSIDTVKRLLLNSELLEMDLIIGPIYKNTFKLVADFANAHKIKCVSPLVSLNTGIYYNNSNVFQIVPSLETQIEEFSKVISNYYNKNIIVLDYGSEKEKNVIELYRKYLLPMLYEKTDSTSISFKVVKLDKDKAFAVIKPVKDDEDKESIDYPIKKYLNDSIPNLVIIPTRDRGVVSNTIRQLNTIYEEQLSNYNISVCGFSNTQNFTNIDIEYLHNLEFHTFTTRWIDYDNANVKDFVLKYREEYKDEPSQFGFQGYDVAYYFLNAMHSFSPDFNNCILTTGFDTTFNCLQNEFIFKQNNQGSFENKRVFVIKYDQDYDVVRIDDLFYNLFENNYIEHPKVEPIQKPDDTEIPVEKPDSTNLRLYHRPD